MSDKIVKRLLLPDNADRTAVVEGHRDALQHRRGSVGPVRTREYIFLLRYDNRSVGRFAEKQIERLDKLRRRLNLI